MWQNKECHQRGLKGSGRDKAGKGEEGVRGIGGRDDGLEPKGG